MSVSRDVLLSYFRTQAPILYLRITPDRRIIETNSFTQALFGQVLLGQDLAQVSQTFAEIPSFAILALDPAREHRFSVSQADGSTLAFDFNFHLVARAEVMALGKLDMSAFQQLQQHLLMMNQETHQLTRELYKRNAELNKQNQLKDQLLGIAAHDLRNPIGAILSLSDLLLDASKALKPGQVQFLESMHQVSESMLKRLDDLLEFARIASAKPTGTGLKLFEPSPKPKQLQMESMPASKLEPLEGACWRILLAEDNPINQLITESMLSKLGFAFKSVGTGFEVLDALGQASFDLILMDCQMPELDGYETTRRIRQGESDRIPIVALTALTQAGSKQKCLAAGMNDYLVKPFSSEQLQAVLVQWLNIVPC